MAIDITALYCCVPKSNTAPARASTSPHRADTGQPEFDLQDRGGIRRGRQGGLFRNCRLRPSLHPTRLAPAVPLVLGSPQKVMLSPTAVSAAAGQVAFGPERLRPWPRWSSGGFCG